MIHASTHVGAERAIHQRTLPIRRLGPRAFVAMLGVELVLIVGVLFWALFTLLPQATPLANASGLTPIEEAIRTRLSGEVHDPLLTLGSGESARASNVRGFSLSGETYYYYVEGATNFDPLSRGAVTTTEVEILLRDESGRKTFVVYRIP